MNNKDVIEYLNRIKSAELDEDLETIIYDIWRQGADENCDGG
jgi:hypothetical protein